MNVENEWMIESVCPGFSRLECDQECATLERNRRLAEALQINFLSDPFNARAPSVYSDSLKEDARSVFCTSFIPALFIVTLMFTVCLLSCVSGRTSSLSPRLKERSGTLWSLLTRWLRSWAADSVVQCALWWSLSAPAFHSFKSCASITAGIALNLNTALKSW